MLAKVGRCPTWVMVGGLFLGACGSGGGGGSSPAATSTATRKATSTPQATATVRPPTATEVPPTSTPTPVVNATATATAPPPTAGASETPTTAPTTPIGGGAETPTELSCPVTTTPAATATPVATATNTPLLGPEVTSLGLADATGSPLTAAGTEGGVVVYRVQFGSGFILFVEGRPGATGLDVGSLTNNRSPFDPAVRSDLQIQANRILGNGSPETCDNSAPNLGGVPAIDPPSYDVNQTISDTLNDLSCRFSTFDEAQFPCTQDGSANFAFTNANTTRQFCVLISNAIAFQTGDTTVTARLRDSGGNAGPPTSVVVRVAR